MLNLLAFRRALSAGTVAMLVVLSQRDVLGQDTASAPSASVRGTVLGPDKVPLEGAIVEVAAVGRVRTDSAGAFLFPALPVGTLILQVTKIGFRPALKMITTRAGEELVVPIALEASGQDLPRVIIHGDSTATLLSDPSGFDFRRRGGMGTFITEDQIAARHFKLTADVLRFAPGVEVDRNGGVAIQRGDISILKVCRGAQLLIDGVAIGDDPAPPDTRDPTRLSASQRAFDVNAITVSSIRGIEIYRGPATTPSVLRTANTVCGTVAIWTK